MNTTTKKITRVQALEIAIANEANVEIVEVLEALKASIEKANGRKSTNKKSTVAQAQMLELVEQLNEESFLSYGDLILDFAEFSNQKFTALMRKAIEQGLVEKGQSASKKVGYRLVK